MPGDRVSLTDADTVILAEPGGEIHAVAITDLDGDGLADVAVAHRSSVRDGTLRPTEIHLFYGRPVFERFVPLSSSDVVLTTEPMDYGDASVAAAGDLNGDGLDDLLMGATRGDLCPKGTGYVQYGSRIRLSGDLRMEVTLSPPDCRRVDGPIPAGDIDGDGIDDFFVPAEGLEGSGLHLFYGGPERLAGEVVVTSGADSTWPYGEVRALGDINGDGYDDLYFETAGPGADRGAVLGGPELMAPVFDQLGPRAEMGFWFSRGWPLDLDNDNVTEVALTSASGAGIVYGGTHLDRSTTLGSDQLGLLMRGEVPIDTVGSGGDMNGDGWPDTYLTNCTNGDLSDYGVAYVLFGDGLRGPVETIDLSLQAVVLLGPANTGGGFCSDRIAAGRDIDGDGLSDLVIATNPRDGVSRVYLLWGRR